MKYFHMHKFILTCGYLLCFGLSNVIAQQADTQSEMDFYTIKTILIKHNIFTGKNAFSVFTHSF
jgi:hypothetical protein